MTGELARAARPDPAAGLGELPGPHRDFRMPAVVEAVDDGVVGVTSLVRAEYYPTAGMYLFYAVFVVIGFFVWWRASRTVVDTSDTGECHREEVPA